LIQTILIFALGFLAALLIALAVAPAVWRRAVYLTRKRIESSLPLSLNELNAEKDALRAEHAMAVSKLDHRVSKLRDKDARQMATIADQSGRIGDLEQKLAESLTRGAQLEAEVDELSGKLDERTTEFSETSVTLEATRSELDVKSTELQTTLLRIEDLAAWLDDAKSEMSEREARIGGLSANLAELKTERKGFQREIRELKAEVKSSGDLLGMERRKAAEIEGKLEKAIGERSDLEEKIERREKELGRAQDLITRAEAECMEMEDRATLAEEERHALEKEVAEMTLRVNRLMAAFGEGDPEKIVGELNDRIEKQEAKIKKLREQRDELKKALKKAEKGISGEIGEEVLREKLNQLAAEVVAMAANIEGPQSRINTILKDQGERPASDVVSLAERIRELQRKAGEQRRA
jgi:chromosome segregation ATPase